MDKEPRKRKFSAVEDGVKDLSEVERKNINLLFRGLLDRESNLPCVIDNALQLQDLVIVRPRVVFTCFRELSQRCDELLVEEPANSAVKERPHLLTQQKVGDNNITMKAVQDKLERNKQDEDITQPNYQVDIQALKRGIQENVLGMEALNAWLAEKDSQLQALAGPGPQQQDAQVDVQGQQSDLHSSAEAPAAAELKAKEIQQLVEACDQHRALSTLSENAAMAEEIRLKDAVLQSKEMQLNAMVEEVRLKDAVIRGKDIQHKEVTQPRDTLINTQEEIIQQLRKQVAELQQFKQSVTSLVVPHQMVA